MLISRDIFYHQLKKIDPDYNLDNIKILETPYKTYDLYVAFSKKRKGYKQLTNNFNKGLDQLIATGRYDKIMKRKILE